MAINDDLLNPWEDEVEFTPEEAENLPGEGEVVFSPDETDADVIFSPEETGYLAESTYDDVDDVDVQFTPEESEGIDFSFEPMQFDDVVGQDAFPPSDWMGPAEMATPERDTDMVGAQTMPWEPIEQYINIPLGQTFTPEKDTDMVGPDVLESPGAAIAAVRGLPEEQEEFDPYEGLPLAEEENLLPIERDTMEAVPGQSRAEGLPVSDLDKALWRPTTTQGVRETAAQRAMQKAQTAQYGAGRFKDEIDAKRIEDQKNLADYQQTQLDIQKETRKLLKEAEMIRKRSPDPNNWFKTDGALKAVATGLAAIGGGVLAAIHGGPNQGLAAIDAEIERDFQAQLVDIQNARTGIDDRRGILHDMATLSDSMYRTKTAASLAFWQDTKERILAEMATLDPRGSQFLDMTEAVQTIDMMMASKAAEAGRFHIEQEQKRLDREQRDRDSRRDYAASIAGTKVTQRGQDMTYDAKLIELEAQKQAVAADLAAKGKLAESQDAAKNLLPNVYAFNPKEPGKKFRVYGPEGQSEALRTELINRMASRELIQRGIKQLREVRKIEGFELWDAKQKSILTDVINEWGRLKDKKQMTVQEIEGGMAATGRPGTGWFLDELRRDDTALDRLSDIADVTVLKDLKYKARGGLYEGMNFGFIQEQELEKDEGAEDLPVFLESGEVSSKAYVPELSAKKDLQRQLERLDVASHEVWSNENNWVRKQSVLTLDKNFAKTKGRALPHLERALADPNSPMVRGVAADALARHGDVDSYRALLQVAENDSDPTVRKRAARAAVVLQTKPEIQKRLKEDAAVKPEPINLETPPNYSLGYDEAVGVKASGSRLSVEELEKRRNEREKRFPKAIK